MPIYLRESFGVAASDAAKASSVFPMGCLIALVGGGFLYDRVSRKGRVAMLGGTLSAEGTADEFTVRARVPLARMESPD